MPVDPMELLAWIAERERDFPQAPLIGNTLMQEAAGLAGDDGLPWDAVAKAAARLRKRGYLDWDYVLWPNESEEPPPERIDYMNFQRTRDITISGSAQQVLATQGVSNPVTQVNIINSTVGQLALGDVSNIDMFVILEAAERALARIDAPPEAKEEARGVIARMKDAGSSVISAAASEVLAAAVRQGLGLP
jgi:hypothetical protein